MSSSNSSRKKEKRITMRLKKANPLFEKWLTEWKCEVKEKGSKSEYSFRKALYSLRKYPLPLKSGKDCKILIGFGDKLCRMLDIKLKEYRSNEYKSFVYSNVVDLGESESNIEKSTAVSEIRNIQSFADAETKHVISEVSLPHIQSQNSQKTETIIMSPNEFDIILYVDTHETGGFSTDDPLLLELGHLSVIYEIKHLKVGDYTWVCRHRTTHKELVLPYIVERKRLDDLASSIKDGRYYEQKYRLKKSGIQNIYYLVENYSQKHVGLPICTLQQAAINTVVQDGFYLQTTHNIKHTAKFLSNFSKVLDINFKSKTVYSCNKVNLEKVSTNDHLVNLLTFEDFNKSSSKNKCMEVTDLFVKMLVQLNGMSVDKATAITDIYPTLTMLMRAYHDNPGTKGDALLAKLQFGKHKKKIGPLLSKTVHQLLTCNSFNT